MRGRGRTIASVLAEALGPVEGARAPALAAAFAEACGGPLSRELSLRGITSDGRLLVVASSQAWADQLLVLARRIEVRVNARLGRALVRGTEVRVGPLGR